MNHIVIYQKNNGKILLRPRKCIYGLQIGDGTAMGWKVLNILYEYEGNYYTYMDWCRVRRGKQLKTKEKKKVLKFVIRQLNRMV